MRNLWQAGRQETVEEARAKAVKFAQAMLDGTAGIIDTARKLSSLRSDIWDRDDPDFKFFAEVVSETVHLPAPGGDDVRGWNHHRLPGKLDEAQKYEGEVRERAVQACRNVIEKFPAPPPNPS